MHSHTIFPFTKHIAVPSLHNFSFPPFNSTCIHFIITPPLILHHFNHLHALIIKLFIIASRKWARKLPKHMQIHPCRGFPLLPLCNSSFHMCPSCFSIIPPHKCLNKQPYVPSTTPINTLAFIHSLPIQFISHISIHNTSHNTNTIPLPWVPFHFLCSFSPSLQPLSNHFPSLQNTSHNPQSSP